MKIFEYKHADLGFAFGRISKALHDYAPSNISWVQDIDSCDIVLVHEVGAGEVPVMEQVLSHNKKLIIFQHTYFTSEYFNWNEFWERAELVVSFHDLRTYVPTSTANLFTTPWGADNKIFSRLAVRKFRKVFTTGYIKETENLFELYQACENTQNTMYHTGADFKFGKYYSHLSFLNDRDFNLMLNSCQYISCLRDIEGFEMMGVEGLFCGARPIVPDLPTYRWYKDHAIFIDMKGDIVKQLENTLNISPKEPDLQEMKEIKDKFSWQNIIPKIFMGIK